MSAPHSTTEIVYDRETHDYAMYLGGELVGFARTYDDDARWPVTVAGVVVEGGCQMCWEAECAAGWWDAAPYFALLDAAADPEEQDGPQEEGGEGGPSEPPDIWYTLTSEQRQEIDLLCACADGEHIRDWAGVDALAAFVGRGLRDRWHPMLGERVRALPSGDVGVLLAVDEHGYLLVDGDARICLPRAQVERLTFDLAASPDSPAPSLLPTAPAGGAAANAAGLYLARCYAWQQRAAALGLTHGRAA